MKCLSNCLWGQITVLHTHQHHRPQKMSRFTTARRNFSLRWENDRPGQKQPEDTWEGFLSTWLWAPTVCRCVHVWGTDQHSHYSQVFRTLSLNQSFQETQHGSDSLWFLWNQQTPPLLIVSGDSNMAARWTYQCWAWPALPWYWQWGWGLGWRVLPLTAKQIWKIPVYRVTAPLHSAFKLLTQPF